MLMHSSLSKKLDKKLKDLSKLYGTGRVQEALNEDGTLNPQKFSRLPEVKEVIKFMVDNDIKTKDLFDSGFAAAAMLFDFSAVTGENP